MPRAYRRRAAVVKLRAALPQLRAMPPRLSVLVPVYNEVATVRTLLERVMAVPIPKEIIVVDDGSTDGTRGVLEEVRRAHPDTPENRLVLVFHARNQGKGAAVRTAVGHVSGEIVLIQDGDLEYDPAEYPRLIAPIVDGHATWCSAPALPAARGGCCSSGTRSPTAC